MKHIVRDVTCECGRIMDVEVNILGVIDRDPQRDTFEVEVDSIAIHNEDETDTIIHSDTCPCGYNLSLDSDITLRCIEYYNDR